MTIDSLLGGGYLRRPMSQTIGVVTLRALCQESDEGGSSRQIQVQNNKKKREATSLLTLPLLGGGYLRRPMSQTIGVVTLRALC